MFFLGKIKGGKLGIKNIKEFNNFIASFKEEEKLEIRIRKFRKKRTLPQNNLYWLWLEIIGENLGYEPEELHSSFKAMFLTDHTAKLPLVRSTTALTKNEFILYLDKIERKMAEMDIILPNSEDYYENKNK